MAQLQLKYRPEIDGLRAIAVCAVLLFHAQLYTPAGKQILSGGFFGVDIFFVISGYLISRIILTELQESRFSFKTFYMRRARRIFPALFFVLGCSILAASFILYASDMKEFIQSIYSSLFFYSNFLFWQQDPYWATASELKPLLHTWSLAVEEQYYLFVPLLFLVLYKQHFSSLDRLIKLLILFSFVGAIFITPKYPEFSFFMLPTRLWEMMVGSYIAWQELHPKSEKKHNEKYHLWGVHLAFIALLFSFVVASENTPHPSFFTLVPVLSTAFIIKYARPYFYIVQGLSSKFMVSVGLISYSLYLWHYPLFAMAQYSLEELTLGLKILLLCTTVMLSVVTYFIVEKPFRRPQVCPNKVFYTGLVVVLLSLVSGGISLNIKANNIESSVVGKYLAQMEQESLQIEGRDCHNRTLDDLCVLNKDSLMKKPILIVIGDSHADALGFYLAQYAKDKGFEYIHMTMSGCVLAEGYTLFYKGVPWRNCVPEVNKARLDFIKNLKEKPYIVVSGAYHVLMQDFKPYENGVNKSPASNIQYSLQLDDGIHSLGDSIVQTLTEAAQFSKEMVIVYPHPLAGVDPKRIVYKQAQKGNIEYSYDASWFQSYTQEAKGVLDMVHSSNVVRIYPKQELCGGNYCSVFKNDKPYFNDPNHMSPAINKKIAAQIIEKLGL